MEKKDIFIIILGVIILASIVTIAYFLPEESRNEWVESSVKILTDKDQYSPGDTLKVKIENNSENKICFSSCYPYYIQKKNGNWENYRYIDCPNDDIVDNCVEPANVKAFELVLPHIASGPHRLAIGACTTCQLKELFEKEENFFSNRFFVK